MIHIASGIDHMHKNRIMHRDLKPANILIDSTGCLKIADLGLGRIFGSQTLEVYSKVGTPLYMSPELLKGEGYGMKSDIWSIGCILYELCELKSPFRNDGEKINLKELYDRIIEGKFAKMNTKKYSQTIKDMIYSMINMDQNQRSDAETVVTIAKRELNKLKNLLKIDKAFVMEDIYYKLALLDYELYFCRPMSLPRITPTFFVNEEEDYNRTNKFEYFCYLTEWILGCLKMKDHGNHPLSRESSDYDPRRPPKDNAKMIVHNLKNSGVKFSIVFGVSNIINGYGDEVCYILNDLTTEILIRRNYEFKTPTYLPSPTSAGVAIRLEEDEDIDYAEIMDGQGGEEEMEGNDADGLIQDERLPKEATANPAEWYEECQRVRHELLEFENDLMFPQSTGDYSATLLSVKTLSSQVTKSTSALLSSRLSSDILSIQDDLTRIMDKESTLTNLSREYLDSIKEYQENNQLYDQEILRLTVGNKRKIEEYSLLKTQYRTLSDTLKARQNMATDNYRLLELKDTIARVKVVRAVI